MKPIILFITLFVSLVAFGQHNTVSKPFKEWQPLYYIDSVHVDFPKYHFELNKLKSMQVISSYIDSTRQIHGKVFMTSKNPKDYKFLTLRDITSTYKKEKFSPEIFILDNEFMKDTSSFRIDSSYILKIELIKGSEIVYLKKHDANMAILKITTRTKENLARENKKPIK